MTDVRTAYNQWSEQYDSNFNPTRDMEAVVLRDLLADKSFDSCLEIGCGTGKNSEYLATKAKQVLAVDLSEEMMARAKQKLTAENIQFTQADITGDWPFAKDKTFDLATFSLILEHIENLHDVFTKLKTVIKPGGYVYIAELHPFKQYGGSRARFETEEGLQTVHGFQHHISDFTNAAADNCFRIELIKEYFDEPDITGIPRVLAMLFSR